jgi:4-diphosphocytidyl-2-C-methyl-D-erythritol kinase
MPVPSLANSALVLANPGMPLETKAVYSAFDGLARPLDAGQWIAAVADALQSGDQPMAADLRNSLEEAAFVVMPALRDFRNVIARVADGATVALSGSGPTYYILGSDEEWADWMARRLKAAGIPRVQATMVSESW